MKKKKGERSKSIRGKTQLRRRNNSLESFGFVNTKRARYLANVGEIDYKNVELLKKFMTEQGKIMPRRITGTSSKQQRQLKRAILRARILGLVR